MRSRRRPLRVVVSVRRIAVHLPSKRSANDVLPVDLLIA